MDGLGTEQLHSLESITNLVNFKAGKSEMF